MPQDLAAINNGLPNPHESDHWEMPWCNELYDMSPYEGRDLGFEIIPMPEYFDEAAFQNCLCQLNPELALFWGIHCNWSTQVYFYHPDYIGNNEFITDASGYVYQYLYYLPFSRRDYELKPAGRRAKLARPSPEDFRDGEALLDQKANTGAFDSPYRFNAKEYDPEPSAASSRTPLKIKYACEQTGLYYYGARYYNGRTSVWLSAVSPESHKRFGMDPLAHKNLHLQPEPKAASILRCLIKVCYIFIF